MWSALDLLTTLTTDTSYTDYTNYTYYTDYTNCTILTTPINTTSALTSPTKLTMIIIKYYYYFYHYFYFYYNYYVYCFAELYWAAIWYSSCGSRTKRWFCWGVPVQHQTHFSKSWHKDEYVHIYNISNVPLTFLQHITCLWLDYSTH